MINRNNNIKSINGPIPCIIRQELDIMETKLLRQHRLNPNPNIIYSVYHHVAYTKLNPKFSRTIISDQQCLHKNLLW